MHDLRSRIVAEASSWVGAPWKRYGRTRSGVDCVGLLECVFDAAVGKRPSGPRYERRPTTAHAFSEMGKFATRIRREDVGPGDIIHMRYGSESVHFGILMDDGTVVHAAAFARRVIQTPLTFDGDGRAIAFWRLKGIEPWHN